MKAGWKQQKLGEVCEFLNRGISPKYIDNVGVCVLNQKCIRDHKVSFDLSRRHSVKDKPISPERFVRLGDVLVNSTGTGTLGRVAQVREEPDEPTTVDSHVTIVRPRSGMFHSDFFGYMLVVIEDAIKEAGEGCGGQTELARLVLAERFSINYPTGISEQKRIVGILDDAFDGLARATANTEQNLRNARTLFKGYLQSVFSQRGREWVEKQLEEVVDANCTLSYGIVQPGNHYPNGLPIVRPTDLTTKVITLGELKCIDPEVAKSYARTTLRGGELLLCVRGSTGVVSVAAPELAGANVTRGIVPIVFEPSLVRQDFGYFLMASDAIQTQIRAKTYGAALMQINIGDLRRIVVPFPKLKEQKEIAAKLEILAGETQRLESIYQQKLAALNELKKSLLHRAFNGELTRDNGQLTKDNGQ